MLGSMKGRTASCTATRSVSGSRLSSAFCTDPCLDSPPSTTRIGLERTSFSTSSRTQSISSARRATTISMSELSRIGVAIDSDLLEKFDHLIGQRGYTNRSEAFRDLIRDELVRREWAHPDSDVVGTVTLVYDHHVRMLSDKLMDLQHEYHH